MADHLQLALRRKIAVAEMAGDFDRAQRLRERLGEVAPAPEQAVEPVAQPETKADPDGLDSVEFASPAARNAAAAAGLTPSSFWRRPRSSESGFTKADVERIAAPAPAENHEEPT